MANPSAIPVAKYINPDSFHQDGYVSVGSDGYTVVSGLPVNSMIKAFARTAQGVWTCTMQELWPVPSTGGSALLRFIIEVVYPSDPSSSVLIPCVLSDNLATNTTIGSGVINFQFVNASGVKEDLPALGGFRFTIVLQNSNLYL